MRSAGLIRAMNLPFLGRGWRLGILMRRCDVISGKPYWRNSSSASHCFLLPLSISPLFFFLHPYITKGIDSGQAHFLKFNISAYDHNLWNNTTLICKSENIEDSNSFNSAKTQSLFTNKAAQREAGTWWKAVLYTAHSG